MNKRKSWVLGSFAAGTAFGIGISQLIFAQAPTYQTQEIFRTDLFKPALSVGCATQPPGSRDLSPG